MNRARFFPSGIPLALDPHAWGADFVVMGTPIGGMPDFEVSGDVATVAICGPLTHHETAMGVCDCYDAIKQRAHAAFASEAKIVVLNINSPGGDAAGCFELSRELRATARAANKRLIAYTDGCAASAAYAIACAADEIYCTATASLGSIGVMQAMIDQTAADRAMGLNYAVVASGTRKIDGNPHIPLSDGAIANMQAQVDQLAGLFFALVAEQRGKAPEAVRALQGNVFIGARAVAVGLADKVTTWGALLASLNNSSSNKGAEAAMPYDEEMRALRAKLKADTENEDPAKAKKAKKMLAALEDGEKDDDGEDGKKAKAADDDDAKAQAKAEEDEKAKKAKAEEDEKKAAARLASVPQDVLARLHALEIKDARAEDSRARASLLAKRPDFSAETVALFEATDSDGNYIRPLAYLQDAVSTWPKGPVRIVNNPLAASSQVRGTETGAVVENMSASDLSFIDQRMGGAAQASGIKREGKSLELGFMTPAQVDAHLAALEAKKGAS